MFRKDISRASKDALCEREGMALAVRLKSLSLHNQADEEFADSKYSPEPTRGVSDAEASSDAVSDSASESASDSPSEDSASPGSSPPLPRKNPIPNAAEFVRVVLSKVKPPVDLPSGSESESDAEEKETDAKVPLPVVDFVKIRTVRDLNRLANVLVQAARQTEAAQNPTSGASEFLAGRRPQPLRKAPEALELDEMLTKHPTRLVSALLREGVISAKKLLRFYLAKASRILSRAYMEAEELLTKQLSASELRAKRDVDLRRYQDMVRRFEDAEADVDKTLQRLGENARDVIQAFFVRPEIDETPAQIDESIRNDLGNWAQGRDTKDAIENLEKKLRSVLRGFRTLLRAIVEASNPESMTVVDLTEPDVAVRVKQEPRDASAAESGSSGKDEVKAGDAENVMDLTKAPSSGDGVMENPVVQNDSGSSSSSSVLSGSSNYGFGSWSSAASSSSTFGSSSTTSANTVHAPRVRMNPRLPSSNNANPLVPAPVESNARPKRTAEKEEKKKSKEKSKKAKEDERSETDTDEETDTDAVRLSVIGIPIDDYVEQLEERVKKSKQSKKDARSKSMSKFENDATEYELRLKESDEAERARNNSLGRDELRKKQEQEVDAMIQRLEQRYKNEEMDAATE